MKYLIEPFVKGVTYWKVDAKIWSSTHHIKLSPMVEPLYSKFRGSSLLRRTSESLQNHYNYPR